MSGRVFQDALTDCTVTATSTPPTYSWDTAERLSPATIPGHFLSGLERIHLFHRSLSRVVEIARVPRVSVEPVRCRRPLAF
jgi:hypothetical protein